MNRITKMFSKNVKTQESCDNLGTLISLNRDSILDSISRKFSSNQDVSPVEYNFMYNKNFWNRFGTRSKKIRSKKIRSKKIRSKK